MEIRYTKYKHELLLSNTRKTENTKFIKNPNSSLDCSALFRSIGASRRNNEPHCPTGEPRFSAFNRNCLRADSIAIL